MMKRMFVIATAIILCFGIAIFAGSENSAKSPKSEMSSAAIPEMINYQGILTDDTGTPLTTTVSMTFNIYDAESGSSSLWTETHGFVTAFGGFFDVLLGSSNPIPSMVFDEPGRWLGVTVGGDPEMIPRQQIASSAYSYQAGYADEAGSAYDADMVDGQHAEDFLNAASDWGRSGVAASLYEGTTALSAKYLGISAKAADSDLLDGKHATDFLGAASDWGRSGVAASLYEGTTALSAKYLGISAKAADSDALDGYDTSYFATSTHAHSSLDAADGSPTDALYVDNDGKVGIGTTNPGFKLHVAGDIKSESSLKFGDASSTKWTIGPQIADYGYVIYANGAAGYVLVLNRTSGNVGIGTTSPQRPLHINDVLRLEPRSSAPSSPSEGDLYVNSSDHHIYCYLNGSWKQLD